MSPPPPSGKWNTGEIAADARVSFLLALGRALHAAGHSAQALEELLELAATRLGVPGQFFTTPTSIFAAFGIGTQQRTYLIRVQPEETNLGRLADIKVILDKALDGTLSPGQAAEQLAHVTVLESPYSPTLTTLAFALSSAASSVFFGGGPREVTLAAVLGLVTGLLALLAKPIPALQRIFPAAAAFLVAGLAGIAGVAVGNVSVGVATLAGLVVLLPGLMLVGAMGELASGHLASGTARAAGAFIAFLQIGFGVALGTTVAERLVGAASVITPAGLPAGSIWPALIAASLAFTVLLKADRHDAPWIIFGALLAILGSRAGTMLVGAELGPFFGAFGVAIAGAAFSGRTSRPASVVVAPGVLVLVPGSVGFRSIAALLENRVVAGIDTAFAAMLTAIALVAGLLIASVVLPSRRHL
ncbi:MAG: threonine/serine exporter family protein [Gemmatimonadales bacterium]|nr:threonine/serine exporter family protein [Gemmatimonadales bacterium]